MFTFSSHILRSLGRHCCYLSHAFLSHPVLTSLQLRVVFFLPAHPHSLILMYICLRRLDHVPFLGMRKSVSDQISVFAHPNGSNKAMRSTFTFSQLFPCVLSLKSLCNDFPLHPNILAANFLASYMFLPLPVTYFGWMHLYSGPCTLF